MTYTLVLNDEKAALLVKIITDKAKEIHSWIAATQSSARLEEYNNIKELLEVINE